MNPTPASFQAAVQALGEVLRFEHPADRVLRYYFLAHRGLGARDRAFVAESVFAVLRRLHWLRWLAAGELATPRRLLCLALNRLRGASLRSLEALIPAADAEWIAGLPREAEPPAAVAADLPEWVFARLVAQRGAEEALACGRAMQAPAPLDLRVNPAKTRREAVLEAFAAEGIEAAATPFSPLGIRLPDKLALQRHPLFLDGSVEVQDEGSQLLGLLVGARRGERIVDLCAGAGGKTLLLAAQMRSSGQVWACDVSEKRLAQLSPRLKRSGLTNVQPLRIDSEADARLSRLAGKADRVLVDAPCTGLGTLRRNPDLKFRQSEASLAELVAKQARILDAAARLVKPGGVLVYGTCSLLEEENQAQVEAFLARHADFALEPAVAALGIDTLPATEGPYLELSPHRHGTDGFFGARLVRSR